MNKTEELFDQLSYDFEYSERNDDSLVEIGNKIIKMTVMENNPNVLESMFQALFTLVDFHDIANQLALNTIADNWQRYDEQSSDYIISILSYTGDIN